MESKFFEYSWENLLKLYSFHKYRIKSYPSKFHNIVYIDIEVTNSKTIDNEVSEPNYFYLLTIPEYEKLKKIVSENSDKEINKVDCFIVVQYCKFNGDYLEIQFEQDKHIAYLIGYGKLIEV